MTNWLQCRICTKPLRPSDVEAHIRAHDWLKRCVECEQPADAHTGATIYACEDPTT